MEKPAIQDVHVPHEAEMVAVIEAQMGRTSTQGVIPDLDVPSITYLQAEAIAMREKLNLILKVLREVELIPIFVTTLFTYGAAKYGMGHYG